MSPYYKGKFVDFGTRKEISKEWSEMVLEKLGHDGEYELWERFNKWLRSEEGIQALKNSGVPEGQRMPPETFAIAGRAFISGWVARETSQE